MVTIVIIEGPDGAGKSTLVERITKEFGIEVGQRATPDRDKLYTVTRQDTYTALSEAVRGDGPMKVWDRLYYSELVYADVVGRKTEFSLTEQAFVQAVIEALECPVILCLPPFDVVAENERGTHQMAGVHDNLPRIYDDYVTLLAGGTFPEFVTVYDYTVSEWGPRGGGPVTTPLEDILQGIADYAELRKDREWSV